MAALSFDQRMSMAAAIPLVNFEHCGQPHIEPDAAASELSQVVPLPPSTLGRSNWADQVTRGWVRPSVNLEHHVRPERPIYTEYDSLRRDHIVVSCQIACGTPAFVGAYKALAHSVPSLLFPYAGKSVSLSMLCMAVSLLGFTVGGSYLGAHVAAPFVRLKQDRASLIERHRAAATVGGHAASVAVVATIVGMNLYLLGALTKWESQHPGRPLPYGARDVPLLGFVSLWTSPGAVSVSWYVGQLAGPMAASLWQETFRRL